MNGFASLGPTVMPFLSAFGNALKTVFGPFVAVAKEVINVIGAVLPAAFTTAWNLIKVIANQIAGVVTGAFNVIKGAVQVLTGILTGDFGKAWEGVKNIFSGAVKILVSIVTGIYGAMSAAAKGLVNAIGSGISAAWGGVKSLLDSLLGKIVSAVKGIGGALYDAGKFIIGKIGDAIRTVGNAVLGTMVGFINALLTPLNAVLGALGIGGVHITAPHFAEGGIYEGDGKVKGYATGGLVDRPGYFAGEQAPAHPEVILATNPAYRQRNLGLWATAGNMLGVPGFAMGGTYTGTGASGPLTTTTSGPLAAIGGVLSSVLNSLNPLNAFKALMPKIPSLPGAFKDIPGAILKRVLSFVEKNMAKLLASGHGISGAGGPVRLSGGEIIGWPQLNGTVRQLMAAIVSAFPALQVTNTGGGGDHALGHAVDLGASQGVMDRAGAWAQANIGHATKQGIHNPTFSINQGQAVPAGFWGADWPLHRNHIHLAGYAGSVGQSAPGMMPPGTYGYAKGGIPGFATGGIWQVTASRESLGGTGYKGNPIQSQGYSELSIPPSSLNFAGLGRLPYQTPMTIAANNRSVTALKQDIGAGSSFYPVMGLYPGTLSQLGLSGGQFTVDIQDGSGLAPMRGTRISSGSSPMAATVGASTKTATDTLAAQLKAAAKVRPAVISKSTAGLLSSVGKVIANEPASFKALRGSRLAYQRDMEDYSTMTVPAADFVKQDAAGNWVIVPNALTAQMAGEKNLENFLTSKVAVALGNEANQSKQAIGDIKAWQTDFGPNGYIGASIKLINAYVKAYQEIVKQREYIADQKAKLAKATKAADKVTYTKRIASAQAKINDQFKALGLNTNQLLGVSWGQATNGNWAGTGGIVGEWSSLNKKYQVWNNTSTAIGDSMSLFGAQTSRQHTYPENRTPAIGFNSWPDRYRSLGSELDTVHRAMASIHDLQVQAALPPDNLGGGGGVDTSGVGDAGSAAAAAVDPAIAAAAALKAQLLKTQLDQTVAALAAAQAEMSVFTGFAGSPAAGDYTTFLGSFAKGIANVPMEGIAELHKGEAVIPASHNPFTNQTSHHVSVNLNGDTQRFIDDVEVIVDGKKAEIAQHVNSQLGFNVGMARGTPSSPGRIARY